MSINLHHKEISEAITDELDIIASLFVDTDKYKSVIREFQKVKAEKGERPTQQYLRDSLEVNRNQVISLLKDLYKDFRDKLQEGEKYPIHETKVRVCADMKDENWEITTNLKHIPRIGDTFFLPFVRGEPGGEVFKVKDVFHSIERGVHEVIIFVWDSWVQDDEKKQLYHEEREVAKLFKNLMDKID